MHPFSLPLPNRPPTGFGSSDRSLLTAATSALETGIDERDIFLGIPRCTICGIGSEVLEHCHIIPLPEDKRIWPDLKNRGWIPSHAKKRGALEPRNGLLMCPTHHHLFDKYAFFIRFVLETQKFVLINYSGDLYLQQFHGKAVALDTKHPHAPFASLFIIHEMRVRGHHPFAAVAPDTDDDSPWQAWIVTDGIFDAEANSFKRESPSASPAPLSGGNISPQQLPQLQSIGDGASSNKRSLALNADVISEILAATRAMPSWKACEIEGTSWAGTVEENIQKYVTSIGTEDH